MEKYNSPIYTTKRDLLYRVSGEEDFAEVWKQLQFSRREKGIKVSLKDQKDNKLFFSLTEELKKKAEDKADELKDKAVNTCIRTVNGF